MTLAAEEFMRRRAPANLDAHAVSGNAKLKRYPDCRFRRPEPSTRFPALEVKRLEDDSSAESPRNVNLDLADLSLRQFRWW